MAAKGERHQGIANAFGLEFIAFSSGGQSQTQGNGSVRGSVQHCIGSTLSDIAGSQEEAQRPASTIAECVGRPLRLPDDPDSCDGGHHVDWYVRTQATLVDCRTIDEDADFPPKRLREIEPPCWSTFSTQNLSNSRGPTLRLGILTLEAILAVAMRGRQHLPSPTSLGSISRTNEVRVL
jgi:hypothetical protein